MVGVVGAVGLAVGGKHSIFFLLLAFVVHCVLFYFVHRAHVSRLENLTH